MSYVSLDASLNLSIKTVSTGKQGIASVQATVTDSRPFIPTKLVGLSVHWGDGSAEHVIDNQVSPYVISLSHAYGPGSYTIRIRAKNYQLPISDTMVKTFDVEVAGTQTQIIRGTDAGVQPIIYGPILPRESYPNTDDWKWHMSQDSVLLESSAKLLLTTSAGEMLMNPGYGTNIRRMVFNQSDPSLRDAVLQEIRRAFSAFEPRVNVVSVDVQGLSSKEVAVKIQLVSNLDQRDFQIATTIIKT
jgi:phage baseplate assembly protein W